LGDISLTNYHNLL